MDTRGMRYVVYIGGVIKTESVLQRISLSNVHVFGLKMDSDTHLHTDIPTFANSFAVGVSYHSAEVICLYIFVVERGRGGWIDENILQCRFSVSVMNVETFCVKYFVSPALPKIAQHIFTTV